MSEAIKLPPLGDGIEGGQVVSLRVQEGDTVQKEDILLELETDKAVVEVPTPQAGTVEKIHVQPGDTVQVGQVLVSLQGEGSGETPVEEPAPAGRAPGEKTAQAPEAASPAQEKPKDALPARISDEPVEGSPQVPRPREEPLSDLGDVPAGPAARRLARELGLDIRQITGSGRAGRITLDDVKRYARQRVQSGGAGPETVRALPPLPDFSQWGPVETRPIPNLRRKISDNLGAAWPAVPLVTQFDEADITELEEMRKKNVEPVKARGGRLTLTVFALKALVYALREHPRFNTSLDLANGTLVYKKYFHIGVAVDTPDGLIVPVIRDVDQKHFLDLAVELTQLSERARERKVSLEELRGGSISLSNLGGIGGTGFTPLVLPPDVAVVGLARSQVRPVWKEGQFQPRLILPFCVSYDHRVIDGADGARFCRSIAHALENHEELLITG